MQRPFWMEVVPSMTTCWNISLTGVMLLVLLINLRNSSMREQLPLAHLQVREPEHREVK